MKGPKEQHSIHKSHFIWLIILFIISTIFIIVLAMGDSERAGDNLYFAATAVSIILAVIAIIFTLVDSSSQKETIYDLKKLSKEMDQSVEKTQNLLLKTLEKTEEHIESLILMKDELKKHHQESIMELKEELSKSVGRTITEEELDEIFKKSIKNYETTNSQSFTNKDLKDYVKELINEQFKYDDFQKDEALEVIVQVYIHTMGYSEEIAKVHALKMFNYLLKNKDIFYFSKKNNYSTIPF